ncbi:pyridoxamine 5'-phosphate oxidase family protein [Asticcacaulis sp. 201]|uniref:pyridoxamine 5'-phosphate oxidase family protein n=1 Tax=Asticcacaulis sp. 201 TaxID=3028787 RepID=UPI0029170BD1|nr:pyridoxamine 5'-phosphate oxidase family protein [Asticcacaulis sp. 201]MDV6332719.1 pyridoxamine 5'-phosphate oxidase family protein [Asticcacaulis sp. 201]
MSQLTLKDIAEHVKHIDICMMTSKTSDGGLESRPMSNNKDVEYDGDSYFFANDTASAVREIENNPEVNLAYSRLPGLLSKPFFLSVSGRAQLIRDRALMEQHWVPDLEAWFKDGLDTPGIVLIAVKAYALKYWDGSFEGALSV